MTDRKGRMSGLAERQKPFEIQGIFTPALADNSARHRATPDAGSEPHREALGAPLSVRAVAAMLGCSAWTVRQKHVPDGLPYFRSGTNGKLIFFRDQVVAWILHQQRKGGRP